MSGFADTADTNPAGRVALPNGPAPADWRGDRAGSGRPDRPGHDLPSRTRPTQEWSTPAGPRADFARPGDRPRTRDTGSWDTGSAWPETAQAQPAWPQTSQPHGAPSRWPGAGRPDPDAVRPAEARLAPPTEQPRRLHRWTPASARNADTADSPTTFSRPMDFDPRRSQTSAPYGPAGAAVRAAPERELELPEHDSELEPDTAPAKRSGRGKAARAAKADRASKADRVGNADRPGKAGRKARRTAAAEADRLSGVPIAAAAPNDAPPRSPSAVTASAKAASAKAASAMTAANAAASATSRSMTAALPSGAPARTLPRTADAPTRSRRAAARRTRRRRPVYLAIGATVVVVAALVVVLARGMFASSSGPAHMISTPSRLKAFALEPQLAQGMGAQSLRADIVKKGNGEATHVVDAVYEISSGPAAKSGPLIVLFIGGNLSGSASSFVSSFTGLLRGAFVTSPGALGGQAACVPGYSGHPAECAWADNDTFGLFASPTLSAAALGNELRSLRPLVEHVRK